MPSTQNESPQMPVKDMTMPDERIQAAVKATAQMMVDDDERAVAAGLSSIPADEVIVAPNPAEYVAPRYLQKTAPLLASKFGELLGMLRDLNSRFAGERTIEVQATLSLTGEHEWLEEQFFRWCRMYFEIRGNLGRLSPRNDNNPSRLYQDCMEEFDRLVEKRIVQAGTINSSVLNLSQRYMRSAFAEQVMNPDLRGCAASG